MSGQNIEIAPTNRSPAQGIGLKSIPSSKILWSSIKVKEL